MRLVLLLVLAVLLAPPARAVGEDDLDRALARLEALLRSAELREHVETVMGHHGHAQSLSPARLARALFSTGGQKLWPPKSGLGYTDAELAALPEPKMPAGIFFALREPDGPWSVVVLPQEHGWLLQGYGADWRHPIRTREVPLP